MYGFEECADTLSETPEGQRPLGRPRRRWWDNINIDLQKIGMRGVIWFDLAQGRNMWLAVANSVMELHVP